MDKNISLREIINSSDFLEIESVYQQSFICRRSEVEANLRALSKDTFPQSGTALVARGSLARDDFSLYSDVDLLLITDTATDSSYIDQGQIQDYISCRASLVRLGFPKLDYR